MKVLIVYSHSYQQDSVSNKAILEELAKDPDVVIRNLEELYPTGEFDLPTEQQHLLEADAIVFQHPLFWFSVPSMLKKYMDDVFARGFTHGTGGGKLAGKKFYHSFTTGAPSDFYTEEVLKEVTASVRLSASFCGMDYCGHITSHGLNAYVNNETEVVAREHATRLMKAIKG